MPETQENTLLDFLSQFFGRKPGGEPSVPRQVPEDIRTYRPESVDPSFLHPYTGRTPDFLLEALLEQAGPRGATFMGRAVPKGTTETAAQVAARPATDVPEEGFSLPQLLGVGIIGSKAGQLGAKEAKAIISGYRASRGLIPAVQAGDVIKTALGGMHEDAIAALPAKLRADAVRGFVDTRTGKFISEKALFEWDKYKSQVWTPRY